MSSSGVIVRPLEAELSPESLVNTLPDDAPVVLLRSGQPETGLGRYSFVAADPFLTVESRGSGIDFIQPGRRECGFGDPWAAVENLVNRYEMPDELDLPFPLGGCFGYWGYDLRTFLEPTLPRPNTNDLGLPHAFLLFCDTVVVFDHVLNKRWIVSTGLGIDGSRDRARAECRCENWLKRSEAVTDATPPTLQSLRATETSSTPSPGRVDRRVISSMPRDAYLQIVNRAREYIRQGHIYQVNLAHRLTAEWTAGGWTLYQLLKDHSPAPFAAYARGTDFELVSASPEQFLRLSGPEIITRPIKGTRPRSDDPVRDTQLSYELQTSPKELAELVMITDLLRNDLGRVCEFGSIHVKTLAGLERYAHVQHLVSTIHGRLRPNVSHFQALASCFSGGSIIGVPKIRAMQIIDELEPVGRGPYTGALGYIGFNRESQLSIAIRTATVHQSRVHYHAGAGIVADSTAEAEYDETLDKARGFLSAIGLSVTPASIPSRVGASDFETH